MSGVVNFKDLFYEIVLFGTLKNLYWTIERWPKSRVVKFKDLFYEIVLFGTEEFVLNYWKMSLIVQVYYELILFTNLMKE